MADLAQIAELHLEQYEALFREVSRRRNYFLENVVLFHVFVALTQCEVVPRDIYCCSHVKHPL